MAAAGSLWTRVANAAPEEEKPKIEPIDNFKYDLEKQTHWVGPGGSAKEATVEEAVEVAADILYNANMPLVYGLSNVTCETTRAAVGLAEMIGGVIDSHTSL